jgi:hypothetical protein
MTHPDDRKPTMIDRIRSFLFGPSARTLEAEQRLEDAIKRKKIVPRARPLVKQETA